MVLSALDYVRLLIQILMVASGISLLFMAIFPNQRTTANYYFAAFAVTMTVYGLLLLLRLFGLIAPLVGLRAMAVMLISFSSTFYLVVVYFSETPPLWVRRVTFLLLPVFLLGIVLSVTGGLFVDVSADMFSFSLSPIGYVILLAGIGYAGIALWLTAVSDERQVRWLRIPAIGLLLGLIFNGMVPDLPLDILMFMIAAWATVSVLMRQKILVPIDALNQELQSKNDALRGTISELAAEKVRVEQLNHALADANHYKNEFLANVSHELRTPLNAILGYSELLTSPVYGQLNPQQADRIGRIHRNGERLLLMIDSVLDLSRLEMELLQLEIQRFDLSEVLQRVINRLRLQAEEKNIALELTVQDGVHTVEGDALRLEHVIYNLLDNAIKFTANGQVQVTATRFEVIDGRAVSVQDIPETLQLSDGAWLLIRVADTGVGIPPADLDAIFVAFRQRDGSSTREYDGLGIGLAIAHRLIEMHHGFIWVHSVPGEGSQFSVALPISQ